MKDYYKILNIKRDASQEEIKKTYRKLSKEHHPDIGGDENRFKEISEAYNVLGDATKRKEYNEGPKRFNPFNNNPFEGAGNDMENLFNQFFNNRGRHSRPSSPPRPKGRDLHIRLEVELEDIFFSKTKTLKYKRRVNCKTCEGSGGVRKTCIMCNGKGQQEIVTGNAFIRQIHVQPCSACNSRGFTLIHPCITCIGAGMESIDEIFDVGIPSDIENGQEIIFPGQGDAIYKGENGFLKVQIIFKPHSIFGVQGKDLIFKPQISITDWLLGINISIPHFMKEHTLNLKPLSKLEQIYMVRGKGFVRQHDFNGNLLIMPQLKIPTHLTVEEKELVNTLKTKENFKTI